MNIKAELYNDHIEEWRDVKGYKGLYKVSSLGRIKTVDREIIQEKEGAEYKRVMKGKILKPGLLNSGYEVIWLSKNGVVKAHTVHRLIAESFILNPENKKDVNHRDGNKTHNHISNLEWVTRSENIQHSYDQLTRKPKGRKIKCIETNEEFISIIEASKKMNINRHSINHVLSGRNKTAGGYSWIYLK